MKRKIIAQGNSSLVLTLPASWARMNGLNPGDEIEVMAKEDELIVNAKNNGGSKKIMVTVDHPNKNHIRSLILSAYRSGADEIDILTNISEVIDREGNKIKMSQLIYDFVDSLIGISIVGQEDGCFKIKSISHVSEDDFDIVLRRMFFLLMSISKQSLEAVKSESKEKFEEVPITYAGVVKLSNYCLRLLNKKNGCKNKENWYSIVKYLESITSSYKHIAKHYFKIKIKAQKDVIVLFEELNRLTQQLYEFFYTSDKEKLNEFFELRDKIKLDYDKIKMTVDKDGILENIGEIRSKLTRLIEERMIIEYDKNLNTRTS